MKILRCLFLSTLIIGISINASSLRAQTSEQGKRFVATYADLCMELQVSHGVPASIKMGQAILETGAGTSKMFKETNNAFGIKCHRGDWKGDRKHYDDDAKGEPFRRYKNATESFIDHSFFLYTSPRYSTLFTKLEVNDYKGWARGLKAAGYATSPEYANTLIGIIERYELYLLDQGTYPSYFAKVEPLNKVDLKHLARNAENVMDSYSRFVTDIDVESITYGNGRRGIMQIGSTPNVYIADIDTFSVSVFSAAGRGIFIKDGNRFILAKRGESYGSLAKQLGIAERRLRKYNNKKDKGTMLADGEMVFIENPKSRRRA